MTVVTPICYSEQNFGIICLYCQCFQKIYTQTVVITQISSGLEGLRQIFTVIL